MPNWAQEKELIAYDRLFGRTGIFTNNAQHKFENCAGKISLDLSGGFGVDSFFMAKKFEKHIHVEINKELQDCVKYNFQVLKTNNVFFVNTSAEEYIQSIHQNFDLIYLDPIEEIPAIKKW